MDRPKKPKKPLKTARVPDKHHRFEKTPYKWEGNTKPHKPFVLVDDDEIEEIGIKLIKEWSKDAQHPSMCFDEWMESDGPQGAFGEVYLPLFSGFISDEDIVKIKKMLPENAEDVKYYPANDRYNYCPGHVEYAVLKTDKEYKAELAVIEDRFNEYSRRLVKYEEELEKYENWRKEQRIKKMEAELATLKANK